MRVVIFPNDQLYEYYKKGEIKPRYYNPGDIFDELHFVSLHDWDIEPEKIQVTAGRARVFIHTIKGYRRRHIWKLNGYTEQILGLVSDIRPSLVRSYNLCFEGYFSVLCAKKLNVPSIISVHQDYCRWHWLGLLGLSYLKPFLISFIYKIFTEPYVIKNATHIIGTYQATMPYIKRKRTKNIDCIYNKVYAEHFRAGKYKQRERPRLQIISVGRHTRDKNPENLVRAMVNVDAQMLLVGKGELTPALKHLAQGLNIAHKIKFLESVPNSEIPGYYMDSDIFSYVNQFNGIGIPVLEAMAAGLPLVLAEHPFERHTELVDGLALMVRNTPNDFAEAFNRLIKDKELRFSLGREARRRFQQIDGPLMEEKEANLYKEAIKTNAENKGD